MKIITENFILKAEDKCDTQLNCHLKAAVKLPEGNTTKLT